MLCPRSQLGREVETQAGDPKKPEVFRGHDALRGRRRPHPPLHSQARQAVNPLGWKKPPGLLLWGPQGGKPHPSICPPCRAAGRPSRSCHSSRTRKAAYTGQPACRFLPSRPVTDRRDSCSDISSLPPQPSLESPTGEGPLLCCFPVFWPAAVSAIFKWLQLGTSRPAQQGSSPAPRTWISTLESLPFSRL